MLRLRLLPSTVAVCLALAGDAAARDARDAPTAAESRYAAALARAIAADVRVHPVGAPLARIVVRWFDPAQPGYLTVHVLAEPERRKVPDDDAWRPLEWRNAGREERRTTRVERAVRAPAAALERRYEARPAELPDEITPAGERLAPPAIRAALRRLPAALRRAGVRRDRFFAVSASHFEGDGALATLRRLASRRTLAVLRQRNELPSE